jgi:hypothetical protein
MKKSTIIMIIILILIIIATAFVVSTLDSVSAQEVSYCCEKTKSGAWCQNAPIEQCDTTNNLKALPTSCESTSYCELGWCFDSQEGICMENSPERVCELEGGVWEKKKESGEIPLQCTLGCCLVGDQAAFVTQVRCKKLSANLGLETNFRQDITDEVECVAQAQASDVGACVFEREFERTCKFTTKGDCNEIGGQVEGDITNITTGVTFHKDFLCSAEELGTSCGPTKDTICIDGKDEVYFKDSCGNQANIYDASRINDKSYWRMIVPKDESCNPTDDNSNSKSCGNCNYFLGSLCKNYDSGKDKARPTEGDYICRNLDCNFEGQTYKHGETWCADAPGIENSDPGSRHFRMLCFNSDVTVEACADFRNEVCLQSEVNGFRNAQCRVNIWRDCYAQTNQDDCENEDVRDCVWNDEYELASPYAIPGQGTIEEVETERARISGVSDSGVPQATEFQSPITGAFLGIFGNDDENDDSNNGGACFPKYPPGFNFYESSEGNDICALANYECVVKYDKKLIGEKKCIENCDCLSEEFEDERNKMCVSLGDCGNSVNYLGHEGFGDSTNVIKKDEDDFNKERTRGAPGTTQPIGQIVRGLLNG